MATFYNIKDPVGFEHCLLHDKGQWYGVENLGISIEGPRQVILMKVLDALAKGQSLPDNWERLDKD